MSVESKNSQEELPVGSENAPEETVGAVEGSVPVEDQLRSELNEWQVKANEYRDGWQRALAEFSNYRKRIEREQGQTQQRASALIIVRFLDVLDDLERALKNRPNDGDGAVWAEGIDLVYRKLNTLIESSGVTPIQAEGQSFDPTQHEAVTHEEADGFESGQVIEVVKQGYRQGERVLRPAVVRVAK